jgi:hypothetical protein
MSKFQEVGDKFNAVAEEEATLKYWQSIRAFETSLEHLLDALERALASLGRDGHLVHVFLVQVGDADAGQLVEFLDGAHGHDLLLVVAHPDRDGRAPEAVPADGPVLRVRQPVVESTCTQHTNRPHNQIRLVQSPSLTIVPSLTKAGTQ